MYSPTVARVLFVRRRQFDTGADNYSTSRSLRTWRILVQVTSAIFIASHCVPCLAYIAYLVTGMWYMCSGHMQCLCVYVCMLFLSNKLGIVFKPSAGTATDHNQSAKDMDSYLSSSKPVDLCHLLENSNNQKRTKTKCNILEFPRESRC